MLRIHLLTAHERWNVKPFPRSIRARRLIGSSLAGYLVVGESEAGGRAANVRLSEVVDDEGSGSAQGCNFRVWNDAMSVEIVFCLLITAFSDLGELSYLTT